MSTSVQNLGTEKPKVAGPAASSSNDRIIRVGVGIFVLKAGDTSPDAGAFIVGKRLGSTGAGSWSIPGGHLEFGESFEQCASRELEEETGLQVPPEKMRYLTTINTVYEEMGKKYHFITVAMGCEMLDEEQPEIREPDKCEVWRWTNWDVLQKLAKGEYVDDVLFGDLFPPLHNLVITAVSERELDSFEPYEIWKCAEVRAARLEQLESGEE